MQLINLTTEKIRLVVMYLDDYVVCLYVENYSYGIHIDMNISKAVYVHPSARVCMYAYKRTERKYNACNRIPSYSTCVYLLLSKAIC